jgi:23S rRNA (cytosine1962-C5)-methyltransferase
LPLALDMYADRAHLQEYSRPDMAENDRRAWLEAMRAAAASALGLEPGRVVLKLRHGQRPEAQYRKVDSRADDFIVTEGGFRFVVNLTDYLDTGLFLDHRQTRAMVGALAAGKRFLNLFCYTASFTVHAVRGGAATSTSVDLSRTYLDWARRNFALNGLDPEKHRLVQADVFRFLEQERGTERRYDLIVLDPPSFSNSKRMQGVLDIQRDHVHLIRGSIDLLDPAGMLFFSTNLRSFRVDSAGLHGLEVADISAQTVPPDFRNRKIHRCWRITRATSGDK